MLEAAPLVTAPLVTAPLSILERHPRLKIVIAESGVGRVPWVVEELDYRHWRLWECKEFWHDKGGIPHTMKPSELFQRQVYGTFQRSPTAMRLLEFWGPEKHAVDERILAPGQHLAQLGPHDQRNDGPPPAETVRGLVGGNAARLYGLDLSLATVRAHCRSGPIAWRPERGKAAPHPARQSRARAVQDGFPIATAETPMPLTLPPPILRYFDGNARFDVPAMLAPFAADAVVRDEKHTHRGTNAIRQWIEQASVGARAMAEPQAIRSDGNAHQVTANVSGSFPGSPITLCFHFVLEGETITELEIG